MSKASWGQCDAARGAPADRRVGKRLSSVVTPRLVDWSGCGSWERAGGGANRGAMNVWRTVAGWGVRPPLRSAELLLPLVAASRRRAG